MDGPRTTDQAASVSEGLKAELDQGDQLDQGDEAVWPPLTGRQWLVCSRVAWAGSGGKGGGV